MATENITISKASLLKAYREAEPSQQEFLKKLFGADKFAISFNVMDRVKTFQDAIDELGTTRSFSSTIRSFGSTIKSIAGLTILGTLTSLPISSYVSLLLR